MSAQERTTHHSFLPLVFEGAHFRMFLDDDGLPWFVAQDVCTLLDLSDVSMALSRLDDDEKGTILIRTLGGPQQMLTVNEYGLYALVLGSRKPHAKPFQRWVRRDVLPEIRRTGTYGYPEPRLKAQTTPTIKERKHVSMLLLATWCLLRDTEEWLYPSEIAQRTRVKVATVRLHIRYLKSLGLIDMVESHPTHQYRISPTAEQRNPAAYTRIQFVAEVMQERIRKEYGV